VADFSDLACEIDMMENAYVLAAERLVRVALLSNGNTTLALQAVLLDALGKLVPVLPRRPLGAVEGTSGFEGIPLSLIRVLVHDRFIPVTRTANPYVLHVNDPLVDLAGLILLLGEVSSIGDGRKGQQRRNVLHLGCVQMILLSLNEQE
jgi:hypothetical protein